MKKLILNKFSPLYAKALYAFMLCFVLNILFNQLNAQEQKKGANHSSLSVGAEVAIPTGDLGIVAGVGLGASAKAILPISHATALTINAGYIYYTKKELGGYQVGGFNSIPLKAGVRISTGKGFYFEPQLGYSIFSAGGESDGAFTYAGNVGYLINHAVDISARYESATKDGVSLSHVGVRIAYNFSLGKK